MDRVLAAEREAQEQLEACRAEADQILAGARERARVIADTTQRRISRIHAASHRQTADRIRSMRRETSKLSEEIDYEPSHSGAVDEAARILAKRLTSRDHGDL